MRGDRGGTESACVLWKGEMLWAWAAMGELRADYESRKGFRDMEGDWKDLQEYRYD